MNIIWFRRTQLWVEILVIIEFFFNKLKNYLSGTYRKPFSKDKTILLFRSTCMTTYRSWTAPASCSSETRSRRSSGTDISTKEDTSDSRRRVSLSEKVTMTFDVWPLVCDVWFVTFDVTLDIWRLMLNFWCDVWCDVGYEVWCDVICNV